MGTSTSSKPTSSKPVQKLICSKPYKVIVVSNVITPSQHVQTSSNPVIEMSDFSAITAAITAVQQSHVALVADLRAQILSKDAEIATMRQRLADMDDPTTDSPSCITPAMWRTGGKHCPQQPEVGEVIAFLLATDSVMQKKQVTEHFSSKPSSWAKNMDGSAGILRELKEQGIISIVE